MGMSALASSRYVLSAMVVSRVFSRSAHGHLPEWVLVRGPLDLGDGLPHLSGDADVKGDSDGGDDDGRIFGRLDYALRESDELAVAGILHRP